MEAWGSPSLRPQGNPAGASPHPAGELLSSLAYLNQLCMIFFYISVHTLHWQDFQGAQSRGLVYQDAAALSIQDGPSFFPFSLTATVKHTHTHTQSFLLVCKAPMTPFGVLNFRSLTAVPTAFGSKNIPYGNSPIGSIKVSHK